MFKTKKEIKRWLDEYEIIDYTINDDLSVDVDDNVNLSCKDLTEIPVQFNVVKGHFSCSNNNLTSLVGSPKIVNGYFDCYHNQLKSLVGSPKIVNGYFDCYNNQLTSLKGSPKEVNGWFDCFSNKLTSLEHLPEIRGKLVCDKDLHETKEYKVYEISKRLREMV